MVDSLITLRAEEADDAPHLQRLFLACHATADWMPLTLRDQVDFAAATQGETVTVAVDTDGDLAGMISLQPAARFVHHLFVDPAMQGRGIGRLLLRVLADHLETPWRLKCVCKNRRALDFYARHGWHRIASGAAPEGDYYLLERRTSR